MLVLLMQLFCHYVFIFQFKQLLFLHLKRFKGTHEVVVEVWDKLINICIIKMVDRMPLLL